jgi:hypothetical protein
MHHDPYYVDGVDSPRNVYVHLQRCSLRADGDGGQELGVEAAPTLIIPLATQAP